MIPNNNLSTKDDFSIKGLLDALRRFNSKERFYLVGHFLGNPNFMPDKARLAELEDKLGIIPKGTFVDAGPTNTFCAMDYHLDWLNGALELAFLPTAGGNPIGSRITGSQEDIDLLLAFDTPNHLKHHHIVLVEAKGVISFSNSQLESKLKRLNDIFFIDGGQPRFQNLEVHLVLAAPRHPTGDRLHWSSNIWEQIFSHLPIPKKLLKITRTDNSGKPTKKGWSQWEIEERRQGEKRNKADV